MTEEEEEEVEEEEEEEDKKKKKKSNRSRRIQHRDFLDVRKNHLFDESWKRIEKRKSRQEGRGSSRKTATRVNVCTTALCGKGRGSERERR